MIYQIIRSPELRPFPGVSQPSDCSLWEDEVCQKVVDYTLNVWKELGKPSKVFLGVDGVVPMAKIRQQRLRRFKSIWTAAEETRQGLRDPSVPRWDTNAITPGTSFMDRLGKRLAKLCEVQKWTLQGVETEGEGEQKCMDFWKENKDTQGDIVIYGLDADLILLCLLTRQLIGDSQQQIWCFRETAEWEGGKDKGLAPYMRLSINRLQDALFQKNVQEKQWILDYVAAMSFLGNDFVPHGISLRIREGGHDSLLKSLSTLHQNGKTLVYLDTDGLYKYDVRSIEELCSFWTLQEERNILQFLKGKSARRNAQDWNMLPCEWAVEEKVLCQTKGVLRTDWKQRYYSEWFGPSVTPDQVCEQYARGLQWVLNYYTKQCAIDVTWIYPWSLPPLWTDWLAYLKKVSSLPTASAPVDIQIQPQEQLAMVLPLESWQLVKDPKLSSLPRQYPHFWPKSYGFFSAGRLHTWECEAELPLIHLPTVRGIGLKKP